MSCTLDSDLLQEFPLSYIGIYVSCTQPTIPADPAYIPDQINGWNIQLERDAQTNTVAQQPKSHEVNPYPDELRYVGGCDEVFGLQNQEILFDRVEFMVYDSILVGSTAEDADGDPFQDAAVIDAIKASVLSNTKVYAQSTFNNGMIGQWQPNWFRPRLEINNKPFLSTGQNGVSGNNSIADPSIGFPLPHCETFHYRSRMTINTLRIYAKCAQYIGDNDTPPTGKLQRYPVFCYVHFRMRNPS